ncbi:hypothetical protein LCGC14_0809480 [marine sediment metagenome]|uniref:Uncharacterized protein n=1 Tax=marine sediment metagenome TaxID=412755 RepID=A0A0F9SUP9_9ZZZZ|nr:hypothetical protein [Candidatus Aminicenantes bacterium]
MKNKRIVRLAELIGGWPRGTRVSIDNISIDDMEKHITKEIKSLKLQVSDLMDLVDRIKRDSKMKELFLRNILLPR